MAFEEANLIIACKKIAFADMDPSKFLAPEIEKTTITATITAFISAR